MVDHSLVAEDYFNNPRNGMKVKPIENSVPLRPKLVTVTKSNKVSQHIIVFTSLN